MRAKASCYASRRTCAAYNFLSFDKITEYDRFFSAAVLRRGSLPYILLRHSKKGRDLPVLFAVAEEEGFEPSKRL